MLAREEKSVHCCLADTRGQSERREQAGGLSGEQPGWRSDKKSFHVAWPGVNVCYFSEGIRNFYKV
ncbi:hypothetical protein NQZ68_019180 [Dissostichus eleginoides]|nr:hypothetical protein NQZ68_019180 [Dissostichus eleginoides]